MLLLVASLIMIQLLIQVEYMEIQSNIKNTQHSSLRGKIFKSSMQAAIFLILGISIFLGGTNALIYYQNTQFSPKQNADAIVVLGAHIEGRPLRPSLMLQYRLDQAIKYWQTNPDVIIVTTGGKTPGYSQSEAEVMQQYLMRFGIPETQILLEDQSTRTAHQFVNALKVLEKASIYPESVIIVTNDFHLPRSIMLAKRSGLKDVSGLAGQTPSDIGSQITAHIREPLAYLNSWLFD